MRPARILRYERNFSTLKFLNFHVFSHAFVNLILVQCIKLMTAADYDHQNDDNQLLDTQQKHGCSLRRH